MLTGTISDFDADGQFGVIDAWRGRTGLYGDSLKSIHQRRIYPRTISGQLHLSLQEHTAMYGLPPCSVQTLKR